MSGKISSFVRFNLRVRQRVVLRVWRNIVVEVVKVNGEIVRLVRTPKTPVHDATAELNLLSAFCRSEAVNSGVDCAAQACAVSVERLKL